MYHLCNIHDIIIFKKKSQAIFLIMRTCLKNIQKIYDRLLCGMKKRITLHSQKRKQLLLWRDSSVG